MDRDLWQVIEEDKPKEKSKEKAKETKSTSNELKVWNSSDWRARNLIRLCLVDSILVNVTFEKTTKDL